MQYYALLNAQNVVTEVFAGKNPGENGVSDWELYYSQVRGVPCKMTSYTGAFRKNFAGVGYTYDPQRNAFIPPRPNPAEYYTLDETTCRWVMVLEGYRYHINIAVKEHLNQVAFNHGYDSIVSLTSYDKDPNPKWVAEAQAGIVWRSAVWQKVEEIEAQVISGQRPVPTPGQVLSELPVIQWP